MSQRVFGLLHGWIEALEFDSCPVGAELPVEFCSLLVALDLPGGDLFAPGVEVGNPAILTRAGQNGQFTLDHSEPMALRGGVVKLQLVGDPTGRGRGQDPVPRGGVGVLRLSTTHRTRSAVGK